MKSSNKHFWYILDLLLFAAINIFLLWKFSSRLSGIVFSWMDLVIFGLAVFRAANVISNEQVTKPLREPFVDEHDKGTKTVEVPKRVGLKGAIGSLIYCPSCTGTWVAMILFYLWILWPLPTKAVAIILALSGSERIFTSIYNFLKK
jgi:hypothetical protein